MEKLNVLGKARFIRLFIVLGIIFTASWKSEVYKSRGDFLKIYVHAPKAKKRNTILTPKI